MIPSLNQEGFLPEGLHDCRVEEIEARFGRFLLSDRRPRLWARFKEFVAQAPAGGVIQAIVVDGSFVTAKPDPNDIDLVLIVPSDHDFSAELTPSQYNLLAQARVQKRFGFDIVVVKDGSENCEVAIQFFQQVRQRPGVKKGLLRLSL